MSWLRRLFRGRESKPAQPPAGSADAAITLRHGQPTSTDAAFDAWTSGDVKEMLAALDSKTHPIDRHFLLMSIVSESYKHRNKPELAETCLRVGRMHVAEFSQLAVALRKEFADRLQGQLPRVTSFQQLATLLTERGEFDEAVRICEHALNFGLSDGTKGGFSQRTDRIKRKAASRKNSSSSC